MSDGDNAVLLALLKDIHAGQKEQGQQLIDVRERLLRIEAQGHSDRIEQLAKQITDILERIGNNSDRLLVIETKGKTATAAIALFCSAIMSAAVGLLLYLVKGN